ncbi:hypothetical protein GCM10028773_26960 [Spirosoma koreense]
MAALLVGLNACNKNAVDPASTDGSARNSSVTSQTATGPKSLTTVDVSSLPATVTTYISTNYAGATIKEAKKDMAGNFVVVISLNHAVKLLLFKVDGTFLKEADGRPKHGPGDSTHHAPGDTAHHHRPMPGDTAHHPRPAPGDTTHRPKPGQGGPGLGLTDVAVSSLPATITSYISTNYAGATIERAGQEKKTSDYVVVIKTSDSKHVLLLFGSDGTFKKALTGK